MPKPRRNVLAAAEETINPPSSLDASQQICKVRGAAGNNLYHVETTDAQVLLVELAQKFRSTIWLKRGSYVLVDSSTLADRENKIAGEIINVVRDDKKWMRMPYWPVAFSGAKRGYGEDSDENESTVGRMPPSESDDES